jgi:hypothetical protein
MSDIPADYQGRLDLREQVTRIDEMIFRIERQQEATRKFVAEQHKLMAEGAKFNREVWIVPLTAAFTVLGAILAAVTARLPEIPHALGIGR